jgi:hypothetical protein
MNNLEWIIENVSQRFIFKYANVWYFRNEFENIRVTII